VTTLRVSNKWICPNLKKRYFSLFCVTLHLFNIQKLRFSDAGMAQDSDHTDSYNRRLASEPSQSETKAMTTTTQTYTVRLRERGQVTIPQPVRNKLVANEGDMLTLVQIDDLVLLTPRQLRLPALTEQFTAEMEKGNVSLADLLQGLAEERAALHQERQQPHPKSNA
jgi:AbrB family looped-hinge helix DNA binding protein